jgi:hypothetical protein
MAQTLTTPDEWRRRAQQARAWLADHPAAEADAEPPAHMLGAVAVQGLAALDDGDLPRASDAARDARTIVWDQPDDVPGVRIGNDQYVLAHAGKQPFDALGWATLFLAKSFEATGAEDDLDAAIEAHDLTVALGDAVWEYPENAPVGLGAAALYALTGEQAFLATAERIADLLCETQGADGSWGGDLVLTAHAARTLEDAADSAEERGPVEEALEAQARAESEAAAARQADD